jgi:hypothetical protein
MLFSRLWGLGVGKTTFPVFLARKGKLEEGRRQDVTSLGFRFTLGIQDICDRYISIILMAS